MTSLAMGWGASPSVGWGALPRRSRSSTTDPPGCRIEDALQPTPEHGLKAEPQAWCSIVLAQTQKSAEFHAVVVEAGGRRSLVARSEPFRVSRRWAAGARGAPRDEHDALVARLEALGWERVRTAGRWHDTALVLRAPMPPPDTRSATPHRTAAEPAARAPREPSDESAFVPKRAGRRSPAPKRDASESGARKAPATRASATSDPSSQKTRRATSRPAAPSELQPTVHIDAPQEHGRTSAEETSETAQDVSRRAAKRAAEPFRFRAHAERHQAPRRQ